MLAELVAPASTQFVKKIQGFNYVGLPLLMTIRYAIILPTGILAAVNSCQYGANTVLDRTSVA